MAFTKNTALSLLNKSCISCSHSNFQSLYFVTDTNQGISGKWNLIACKNCGLAQLDPFPTPHEIHHFYQDQFYTQDKKRFSNGIELLRSLLAYLRGRKLNTLCINRGTLLDYGSGAGHFAAAQKKIGWNVISYDPYSLSLEENEKIKKEKLLPHSFDTITLWYVIEHLSDPKSVLIQCYEWLKPGGILLLAQQNFSSIQARYFKNRWLFLDPPRHLYQFSPLNLTKLGNQVGFELILTTHGNLETGPFTIFQSLLNTLLGNTNEVFRFLKNRKLRASSSSSLHFHWTRLILSGFLSPILVPLSFLLYFLLNLIGSGDVFHLYLRRPKTIQ